MKKYIHALCMTVLVMCITTSMNAQVSFGKSQLFNDSWSFILCDSKPTDGSNWRTVELPHDWSIEATPSRQWASCTGYLPGGIGWYRKVFRINDREARHYIYFEGVYNRSEVYLNGKLLGRRPNGYISFMYDMTPYLKKGENELLVKVDHSKYADSRWYTGSGIYRNVWMIACGDTHFSQWGIGYTTETKTDNTTGNTSAFIHVNAEIENPRNEQLHIRTRLLETDGNRCVAERTCRAQDIRQHPLEITNPHLWDTDNPYLYLMKVELLSGEKTIDSASINVGIRTLKFDADKGFFLNGNSMKVKGVCIHHDAGVLGSAVPKEVWHRRLIKLKELGANAIRMSHNPQAPDVYDLCDRLGILVMDEASDEWEFPKRKWLKGWNKGEPGYDGTFDFFEEWIDRDVTDMVRRDRNHPCVFLWSIGNEVDYPNDPYSHPILNGDGANINQPMFGGYKPEAPNAERIGKIAKRLAAVVRSVDSSRPVTGALAGVVMSNQTEYPEAVDVVGYNYTEDRYVTDHKLYPKRIIFGSETHADEKAWAAVRDNQHIFGHFVWTGFDYLGESGEWPSRGLGTGLIDFTGALKPNGQYFQALWSNDSSAISKIRQTRMRGWRQNRNNITNAEVHHVNAYTDFEGKELIQLIIELDDAEGNRIVRASNDVKVVVEEGGKLLGIETGSNNDMSDPKANHRKANQGLLLAYIKKEGRNTPVVINIDVEGLERKKLVINK